MSVTSIMLDLTKLRFSTREQIETYWSIPGVLMAPRIDAATTGELKRHSLIASPLWENIMLLTLQGWHCSTDWVEKPAPSVGGGVRRKDKSGGTGIEEVFTIIGRGPRGTNIFCFPSVWVEGALAWWQVDWDCKIPNFKFDLLLFGTHPVRNNNSCSPLVCGRDGSSFERIPLYKVVEHQKWRFEEGLENLP